MIHPDEKLYNRVKESGIIKCSENVTLFCSTVLNHNIIEEWKGDIKFFSTGTQGAKGVVQGLHKFPEIGAGFTVAYTAMALMVEMGYSVVELFGFDFCYLGNKRYAYEEHTYEDITDIDMTLMKTAENKYALTDNVMMKTLECCTKLVRDNPEIRFNVYGDGLFYNEELENLRTIRRQNAR